MRRYEQDWIMKEIAALLEHINIYRLLQRRKRKTSGKRMTLDVLLKAEHLDIPPQPSAFE
jgi:hypothetical protein